MLANGSTADLVHSTHGRSTTDFKTAIRYGFVSAVHGQASGLASMFSDCTESEVQHVVSMNQLDDAGMWVQDPASKAERASGHRSEGRK